MVQVGNVGVVASNVSRVRADVRSVVADIRVVALDGNEVGNRRSSVGIHVSSQRITFVYEKDNFVPSTYLGSCAEETDCEGMDNADGRSDDEKQPCLNNDACTGKET